MSSIQAVLFDFGGVLYRTPDPRRLLSLMRRLGFADPGPMHLLLQSPTESKVVWDIMTGKISEQSLWDELARRWRLRPGWIQYIRRSGYATHRLNRELVEYLAGLRPWIKTAVLTNAASDFRETFCQSFGLERYVDRVIISAEEGLCKPDPRIYLLAAERLGVAPEQAVFVDDIHENVEGARKAGMTAFRHLGNAETIRMTQSLIADGRSAP